MGRRLKAHDPRTRIILADPVGSGLAHWVAHGEVGPDGRYEVEGIGSSRPPANLDRSVIDDAVPVTDEESFAMARRLVREGGMLVGGSAGANLAAAAVVAARADLHGPVVSILCDGWDRYWSKPWMHHWD
ncbi:MAG: pyridoxal-phosphate dependent enzyme [Myxococcota bacterium]